MATEGIPIVLLCDAAFSSLPILFSLKERGFRVAVCGARPNDPGHALADLSFLVDYSDKEALLDLVRSNNIDFVVPGCTDVSYLSCASVAHTVGLPGYDRPESVVIMHRKDAFRKLCQNRAYPIPRFVSDLSDVQRLRLPILVKPSDSFSGRGIARVECYDDVAAATGQAMAHSSASSVIFEEFIEAPLYSHSAVIRSGRIIWDVFVNEYCTVDPYQVNSSHVSVDLSAETMSGVRNWLEEFSHELVLVDGLVHTQFVASEGGFFLIEVTRRCPGDLYAMLVEKSLGIDYAFAYASGFCKKEPLEPTRSSPARRYYSRHTVSVDNDCIFLSAQLTIPACDASFVPVKRTGEMLRAAPLDRAGIYFIEHESAATMRRLTPLLRDYVVVEAPIRH